MLQLRGAPTDAAAGLMPGPYFGLAASFPSSEFQQLRSGDPKLGGSLLPASKLTFFTLSIKKANPTSDKTIKRQQFEQEKRVGMVWPSASILA